MYHGGEEDEEKEPTKDSNGATTRPSATAAVAGHACPE